MVKSVNQIRQEIESLAEGEELALTDYEEALLKRDAVQYGDRIVQIIPLSLGQTVHAIVRKGAATNALPVVCWVVLEETTVLGDFEEDGPYYDKFQHVTAMVAEKGMYLRPLPEYISERRETHFVEYTFS